MQSSFCACRCGLAAQAGLARKNQYLVFSTWYLALSPNSTHFGSAKLLQAYS